MISKGENPSKTLEDALTYQKDYEKLVFDTEIFLQRYVEKALGEEKPVFGIVLGSGLGDIADAIESAEAIHYEMIPNFSKTTVESHEGILIIGKLEGVPIMALKGRTHYYEVADQPFNTGILKVIFPVDVLANLGVKNYFVTNAAGGLNLDYKVGDIMVIRSHIIHLVPNPLLGRQHDFERVDSKKCLRFQQLNAAYDPELRDLLMKAGRRFKNHIHKGVYITVPGPSYETEAECLAYRDGFKADAVGMSTAPEVIAARNRGMKVIGMSCISNTIDEDGTNAASHDEVKRILESEQVRKRLSTTVINFFRFYRKSKIDK